jgi:hypothetical protein
VDKASFEPLSHMTFAAAGGFAGLRELLAMERMADLGLVEPREFRAAFERVVRGAPTTCGWLGVWPMLAVEGFLMSADAERVAA